MPWTPKDAPKHTKKARSAKTKRQWAHVANSALVRGYSEERAITQANGVVKHTIEHSQTSHLPHQKKDPH